MHFVEVKKIGILKIPKAERKRRSENAHELKKKKAERKNPQKFFSNKIKKDYKFENNIIHPNVSEFNEIYVNIYRHRIENFPRREWTLLCLVWM